MSADELDFHSILHSHQVLVTASVVYLDRVFSSVTVAASRVVTSDCSQSVMVLCLPVQRREDVDLSLTKRRGDN